jgi:putative transposase
LGWTVEIVQHPPHPRGEWRIVPEPDDQRALRMVPPPARQDRVPGILPRRWVGERAFSWIAQSRRLAKEYEWLCETSEAMIYATMSRIMVCRLARC